MGLWGAAGAWTEEEFAFAVSGEGLAGVGEGLGVFIGAFAERFGITKNPRKPIGASDFGAGRSWIAGRFARSWCVAALVLRRERVAAGGNGLSVR